MNYLQLKLRVEKATEDAEETEVFRRILNRDVAG
jgi:hypothetical protein